MFKSLFEIFIENREHISKTLSNLLSPYLSPETKKKFFAVSQLNLNHYSLTSNLENIKLNLVDATSYADLKFRILKLKPYLSGNVPYHVKNEVNKIIDNLNNILPKEYAHQKKGIIKVLASELNSSHCSNDRQPSIKTTIADFHARGKENSYFIVDSKRFDFNSLSTEAEDELKKLFDNFDKSLRDFLLANLNQSGFMYLLRYINDLITVEVAPKLIERNELEKELIKGTEKNLSETTRDAEGIRIKRLTPKKVELYRKITYYGIQNARIEKKLFDYPIVLHWCLTIEMKNNVPRFSNPKVFLTLREAATVTKYSNDFLKQFRNIGEGYSAQDWENIMQNRTTVTKYSDSFLKQFRNIGEGYSAQDWENIMQSRKVGTPFLLKPIDLFDARLSDASTATRLYGEDVYLASQIIKQGFSYGGYKILEFENEKKLQASKR